MAIVFSHLKSKQAICRCPFCRFTQVNSFRYLHTYIYVTTQHRYIMFIVHTKPKFVIQTWIQGFTERQECFIISILDNLSKTDCTEYRKYSKIIAFGKFYSFHVVLGRIQVYRHSLTSAVLISTFSILFSLPLVLLSNLDFRGYCFQSLQIKSVN